MFTDLLSVLKLRCGKFGQETFATVAAGVSGMQVQPSNIRGQLGGEEAEAEAESTELAELAEKIVLIMNRFF